jgi:hypothetical protein
VRAFIERHGVGRWFVNFCLIVLLSLAGFYVRGQTNQAEQALCALRGDLQTRIENTERYLEQVDKGERKLIPGLNRADLVQSVRGQRRTVDALASLDCD